MTPEQLAEIKERAAFLMPFTKRGGANRKLVEHDVPALVAEVERLTTRLQAAEAVCTAYAMIGARMETDREKALTDKRNAFEAVISTPNGGWSVAEEIRCTTCGAIAARGGNLSVSLAELDGLANRHECESRSAEEAVI